MAYTPKKFSREVPPATPTKYDLGPEPGTGTAGTLPTEPLDTTDTPEAKDVPVVPESPTIIVDEPPAVEVPGEEPYITVKQEIASSFGGSTQEISVGGDQIVEAPPGEEIPPGGEEIPVP